MNATESARVWAIAEPKAGMLNQVTGLAEALGLPFAVKRVRLRAPWGWGAPWLRPPLSALTADSDPLTPPWPELVIGAGRQAAAVAIAIRAASRGRSKLVQLQDPRVPARWFDLVIPPSHDGLAGPNVLPILGSPHRVTPQRLAAEAARWADLAALPGPRVAVLIGGDSKAHRLSPARARALGRELRALADGGATLLVTLSRRTPAAAAAALRRALQGTSAQVWDGAGENPYFGYLAHAGAILVTEDSTNMAAEAAATGKPVHVLKLDGGAPKFDRFHAALREAGIARPFAGRLESWTYAPLAETQRAADAIRARLFDLGPVAAAAPRRYLDGAAAPAEAPAQGAPMHARVLILGSGPAGYTAAIYAARAMLEPVLVHGLQPGGQLTITTEVENYPGFAEAIQGPWLMEQMGAQAEHVGTKLISDVIVKAELGKRPFRLTGDSGTVYTCDTLIVCTGAQARWLGVPGEAHFQGHGVSACATCDGFFYRGKEVAVVGGGNTAVEEALFLTNFASKVTLIHRRGELRADKTNQKRLFANPKVQVIWDTVVDTVQGTDDPKSVTSLKLKNVGTGAVSELKVDGLFVAIGHVPATQLFAGQLRMDEEGYILTKPDSTQTSVAGVFAAGDVKDKVFRQAVTAAGMGCMAALEAEKFLAHHHQAEPVA